MDTERMRDAILNEFGITWEDFLYLVETLQEDIKASKPEIKLETEKKQKLEVRITTLLYELGIPTCTNGYLYIKNAIEICYNNNTLPSITKVIYPNIAEIYDTIPSRVERDIRYAKEYAWKNNGLEKISRVFCNKISPMEKKPTNSEFLAIVTEYLKLEDKM